jgi:hypothetical protein
LLNLKQWKRNPLVILVNPLASSNSISPKDSRSLEYWSELVKSLLNQDYRVVLNAGNDPLQEYISKNIADRVEKNDHFELRSFSTRQEYIDFMAEKAKAVITIDTGTFHASWELLHLPTVVVTTSLSRQWVPKEQAMLKHVPSENKDLSGTLNSLRQVLEESSTQPGDAVSSAMNTKIQYLDLSSRNIETLFDAWIKGPYAKNELIYQARKLGFEGINIQNNKEYAFNGEAVPEDTYSESLRIQGIYSLYEDGIRENVSQHARGNAVYLWREGLEGYEFLMLDYGPGVIDKNGNPVDNIEKIFNKGVTFRQGTPGPDGVRREGGYGEGAWRTALNSYLLRLISINNGKIHVVTKEPGFIPKIRDFFISPINFLKQNRKHVPTELRISDLPGKISDRSGVVVHGFVPFDRKEFKGQLTEPTDTDLLGSIKVQKPSPSYHGLWQIAPAKELDALKPGDRVIFKYHESTYRAFRKNIHTEAVHTGVLKEVASTDNQGVFIFEDGFIVSYSRIKNVLISRSEEKRQENSAMSFSARSNFEKWITPQIRLGRKPWELKEKDGYLERIRNLRRTEEQQKTWGKPGRYVPSTNSAMKAPGGIDLNPAQITLQVKREGENFHFNFNGLSFNAAQVIGAIFFIRSMTPVTNLPGLLGLS